MGRIAGSFASATPPLHCPLFIVISIIMNKFATKKDRNYTLLGILPLIMEYNKFKIGKAYISNTNFDDTVLQIKNAIQKNTNTYICVTNMRMVRYANKKENHSYLTIMNNSFMNLPDGTPLVWCGRLWGLKKIRCTSGPNLFRKMLSSDDNIKHFLLGDTDEVLDKLKSKYKNKIVGSYSPPFIDVNDYDYDKIAELINKSGADIVWVAMRAPKQDIFSYNISPLLDNKICISVGRAFRIAIGEIKDAPKFFQKLGLSGLFTRRTSLLPTLKWYFITMFFLLYYMLEIIIKRMFMLNKAKNLI